MRSNTNPLEGSTTNDDTHPDVFSWNIGPSDPDHQSEFPDDDEQSEWRIPDESPVTPPADDSPWIHDREPPAIDFQLCPTCGTPFPYGSSCPLGPH